MEIPAVTAGAMAAEAAPAAVTPTRSVWDEPDGDDAFSATEHAPSRPIIAPEAEPAWGFDEAQIEAARRAAVPVHGDEELPASGAVAPTPGPTRRRGMLLPLLLLLLLAGAGYAGWRWWQQHQAPVAPIVIARHPSRNASVSPAVHAVSPPPVVAPAPALTQSAPGPAPVAPPPTTAPAPAPVPTAAVPVSSATAATTAPDAVRSRYDAMAAEFATQKGGNYTLQFELVCETASITRAISEAGGKVWFVPTRYRGRACYRVFWGRFDTSAEASAASKELPAALGKNPVVVKVPHG